MIIIKTFKMSLVVWYMFMLMGVRQCLRTANIRQTGLLFISLMTYEYSKPWRNNTDGKTKELRENLSQCHFVYYKSHMK
jgi:hypothetical protein